MSTRIKKGCRRCGLGNHEIPKIEGTHLVKVAQSGQLSRLNGFMIYHATKGAGEKAPFVVAFTEMERLGYTREDIDKAIKIGFDADPAFLPQMLRFIIMSDAEDPGERDDDGNIIWKYDRLYASGYVCYDKLGMFCHGNGDVAMRKMKDGTQRRLACNPFGKAECEAFCEFSGPGKPCRLNMGFASCLYYWAPEDLDDDGIPIHGRKRKLLSPALGMQALFVFETTSGICDLNLIQILDKTSNRVNGNIKGLTGTMTFSKRGRRTGLKDFAKSVVPAVTVTIDEESILARIARLRGEGDFHPQLSMGQLKSIAGPVIDQNTPKDLLPTAGYVGCAPDFSENDNPLPNRERPIDLEQASNEDLLAALTIWCGKRSEAEGRDWNDVWEEKVRVNHDNKLFVITNLDWFTDPKAPNPQKRNEYLRQICQGLASDPYFVLPEAAKEGEKV